MDAYNRHVQLTKSLLVKAAAELKVATDEPLTRAMQKTVSDAAKKQWAKRKQGDESAEEAAVPAAKSRGQGNGRGNGRGKGGRGKGGRGKGDRGNGDRGKGKGRGRGKGGLAAKLRRSDSKKLSQDGSSTKAKAAPKKKASAKRKAKNLAEAAEAPASMEHPVDRMNAELRAFDDDKGQVFDASKKTWGRVSDELRAKLKPLVYKLEKPLEQV